MLIRRQTSCLLIIDIQERLVPVTTDPRRIIHHGTLLMRAADRLGVPIIVTEQNPERIGPTVIDLREWMPKDGPIAKMGFACAEVPEVMARLKATGRRQVILGGVEAHICALQSALSLKENGWDVFVVTEICGSRRAENEQLTFERLRQAGIPVVGAEMVVFEWLGAAGTPEFKDLLPFIK